MSPNLSMFSSSVKKATQTLFLVAPLMLLSACLPEEKDETKPINNEGKSLNDSVMSLNGFWDGGFNQTETLRVLIYNGNVYGLDEDKAFYGSVIAESKIAINFTLLAAPFTYEDSSNNEYVASGRAVTYTIEASEFTSNGLEVAGAFDTSPDDLHGEVNLFNDGSYTSPSSLNNLFGLWTTTNYELKIDNLGNFIIQDTSESGCYSKGSLKIIDSTKSLLNLTLNRRRCDDFNGDSTGYAAINADGELEFYSKMGSSLLFMTFTAPTGNASNPETDPAEEETPAEQAP